MGNPILSCSFTLSWFPNPDHLSFFILIYLEPYLYIHIYIYIFTIYLPYTIEFTKFTMSDWDIKKPCRSKLLQTIDFTIKTWEFQDPKVEVL
jgi:hypothetical protein